MFGKSLRMSPQDRYDYDKLHAMMLHVDEQKRQVSIGVLTRVDSVRKIAEKFADHPSSAERLRKHFQKFLDSIDNYDLDMLYELELLQRYALDLIEAAVTQFDVPFYSYE